MGPLEESSLYPAGKELLLRLLAGAIPTLLDTVAADKPLNTCDCVLLFARTLNIPNVVVLKKV
jgi:hypothetical protein